MKSFWVEFGRAEIHRAKVSFTEVFVVCSFSLLYALLFLLLSSQELQKKEVLSDAAGSRPVLPVATSDLKAPPLRLSWRRPGRMHQ
jgi:hypothetical protein